MLRLRVAAVVLSGLAVVACGDSESPLELRTIAGDPAVVSLPQRDPGWAEAMRPAPTTTAPPPPTTTTTAAPPPPAPVVRHPAPARPQEPRATGDCAGWASTIAAHFPPEQHRKACTVMLCESHGNPTAENRRSSASGLFQFLSRTWTDITGLAPPASAYSGDRQIAAAAALWRRSGWSPWVCS